MYIKTIIEFGFRDIRNNQGLSKCNQHRPPASADYTCLDLDYSGIIKTSSTSIVYSISMLTLSFLLFNHFGLLYFSIVMFSTVIQIGITCYFHLQNSDLFLITHRITSIAEIRSD